MCTVADFSDRVSTLEGYFEENPTSVFNGGDLYVNKIVITPTANGNSVFTIIVGGYNKRRGIILFFY